MFKIETKIIFGVVFFTFLLVALERYYLSNNIITQFIESKKSKNTLLIDTITPVVGLNLSLGLLDANSEYLNTIAKQNRDLLSIELHDNGGVLLYSYKNESKEESSAESYDFQFANKEVIDELTNKRVARVTLKFSSADYENIELENQMISIKIATVSIVLLVLFILFIKTTFKQLKQLTKSVLEYDPQKNNFRTEALEQDNEIALIYNAFVSMVQKISSYTSELDILNASLEAKVLIRTQELEEKNRELEILATTDPLTKVYNRRHFTASSEDILKATKVESKPISLIMIDIDKFKDVNDTYGHQVGDKVIISLVEMLKKHTRSSDIICRFGGEEFIALLPNTELAVAQTIAQRVRVAVKRSRVDIEDGRSVEYTISLGVSEYNNMANESMEALIHRADHALYRAKESGRDRVCVC